MPEGVGTKFVSGSGTSTSPLGSRPKVLRHMSSLWRGKGRYGTRVVQVGAAAFSTASACTVRRAGAAAYRYEGSHHLWNLASTASYPRFNLRRRCSPIIELCAMLFASPKPQRLAVKAVRSRKPSGVGAKNCKNKRSCCALVHSSFHGEYPAP